MKENFSFHMCKLFFQLGFTNAKKSQTLLKNSLMKKIIIFLKRQNGFTQEKSFFSPTCYHRLRNLKYHDFFFLFTWFHTWKRKMENGSPEKHSSLVCENKWHFTFRGSCYTCAKTFPQLVSQMQIYIYIYIIYL